MVAHIAHHLLMRQENGVPLYPHIDAVIFLSERHATPLHRQIAFPIACIEGQSFRSAVWKNEVVDTLLTRWSKWNGVPLYGSDMRAQKFATIDHIPERMKRYELWQLDYKRRPYMSGFTEEQLRERFDEIMCVSSLAMLEDSPLKPGHDATAWSLSSMSHLMLEMGWRGIPVTQFELGPERLAAAARRLRMPANVIAWFESDMGRAV